MRRGSALDASIARLAPSARIAQAAGRRSGGTPPGRRRRPAHGRPGERQVIRRKTFAAVR